MRYEIVVAPEAERTLRGLCAYERIAVLDAIEAHLRHEPTKVSRSRIKAIRDLRHSHYRLRAGDLRGFYDVGEDSVQVLAVVHKAEASVYLARWGLRISEEGMRS